MIPSQHLARSGCRIVFKAICVYLIPWAKACDKCAAWLAVHKPAVLKWTWHVAAGLLAVVVIVHLAIVGLVIRYMNQAVHTPCVCAASGEPVSLRQDTYSSSLSMFMASLLDLAKATVHTIQCFAQLFSDVCLVVLWRPRTCILTACFGAIVLSVAL